MYVEYNKYPLHYDLMVICTFSGVDCYIWLKLVSVNFFKGDPSFEINNPQPSLTLNTCLPFVSTGN